MYLRLKASEADALYNAKAMPTLNERSINLSGRLKEPVGGGLANPYLANLKLAQCAMPQGLEHFGSNLWVTLFPHFAYR